MGTWWALLRDLRGLRKLSHWWRKRSTHADTHSNNSALPLSPADRVSDWKRSTVIGRLEFVHITTFFFSLDSLELGYERRCLSVCYCWSYKPKTAVWDILQCSSLHPPFLLLPPGEINGISHSTQPCRGLLGISLEEVLNIPPWFFLQSWGETIRFVFRLDCFVLFYFLVPHLESWCARLYCHTKAHGVTPELPSGSREKSNRLTCDAQESLQEARFRCSSCFLCSPERLVRVRRSRDNEQRPATGKERGADWFWTWSETLMPRVCS